ncbi:MAG: NAD-dependent deacylase [Tannerellaceae bacterium]|jgi:NAD-dependent deacetylase|nr:NAD-dependent deacylase [Tannerellaceae bacterium]
MKKLIVFTGAGMSAESGISTFRDSDGLWEQYRVEDVATPEGFAANPSLVLDFYNQRRKQLLTCKPNEGHYGLAALEDFFDVEIITQNVDDLHERGGSSSVLHLHGELMKACAVNDLRTAYTLSPENPVINLGDKDRWGVQLRPFIVWFGEPVPLFETAARKVQTADIFVVIGTSLKVYPAASLLGYARQDIPVYLIDPHPVEVRRQGIHFIQAGASEGVRQLLTLLQCGHE